MRQTEFILKKHEMATLSKICEFMYCHPEPSIFIRAIVGSDNRMFDHLMSKWNHFRRDFGEGAMVRFVGALDAELTKKFDDFAEEWIENNC